MKNRLILFFLFIVALNFCKQPEVTFDAPQPQGLTKLNFFPKKYIGTYYNAEDKVEITISKYSVLEKMISGDTINVNQLDKDEILKDDSLFKINTKEKYKIKRINDSLFTNYIFSDTAFIIGKNNVLKKFKGYLFLSKSIKKGGFWEVQKLSLSKGVITISSIKTENEMKLLETMTETKMDTARPFRIKPTKKQFKEFIKKNGFSEGKIFLKK